MNKIQIKYRFKELRLEFNYTQAFVAQYLNVMQNTYSQYENLKRQPSIEVIIILAKLYNVTTDYILGLTEF